MKRYIAGFLVLGALVLGVWTEAPAAQDSDPLQAAIAAMGTRDIRTLTYSGAGSSYTFGVDADGQETRDYQRVSAYTQNIDYGQDTAELHITRLVGEERREETDDRTIGLDSPWDEQIDLWLDPNVFLREASSTGARSEAVMDLGVHYTMVTLETADGHTLQGYIDDQNVLRKIRTTRTDPVLGERQVEAVYRSYEDFGGIQFPSLLVHKENGLPNLILVVTDVQHEGPPA